MQVRDGYKQTEVGVIPEDWEVRTIGSFSTIYGRIGFRGYTKEDIVKDGEGALALNPSNIQKNKLVFDKCTFITWQKYHESPEIKIQVGDIILVKTGSTTGKTSYVSYLPIEATLNPQMVVFKGVHADNRLVAFIFSTSLFLNQIAATIVGGALPTLSQKQVANYTIPLPPTKAEQEAIAGALSDADAWIESLEQLIAKKRRIKEGSMQALLTGKQRLPGFSGEWEEKTLGDIARIVRGASPRPIDDPVWFDPKSPVGWVRISDVTKSGIYLNETQQKLSSAGIAKSRPVEKDSLIMSICATVGRPIITKLNVCIHDGFVVFENLKANQRYTYYVLKAIEPKWSEHGQTGSQMNLNTTLINGTSIKLPPEDEQTAIAEVLSEMDTEIDTLEAKLAKARQIKQGMMQELLTGKTRLV